MNEIPVSIVTGFLGAGKTTFLNRLLRADGFARTAVIINEFGEVGLDHLFIEGRGEGLIELSNGCLCCTLRGELAVTLADLPRERIDRVIVETTGLADPGPVLQAAMTVPGYRPGGMVALLDALNAPLQLETQAEARRQIALSDLVAITKLDMIDAGDRAERMRQVGALAAFLNPQAERLALQDMVLSPSLFDRLESHPTGTQLPAPTPGDGSMHCHDHDHDNEHEHDHEHDHGHHRADAAYGAASHHGERIRSVVLRHDRPIPRRALEAFCELLGSAHARALLRLKGLVSVEGLAGPLVVHGIHGLFHEPQELPAWPDADRSTRIVVILEDLDPDFVVRLFSGLAGRALADTPDRAALIDNPLAIAGFSPSR